MLLSEYIKRLQALKRKHGDVPVVIGRYSNLTLDNAVELLEIGEAEGYPRATSFIERVGRTRQDSGWGRELLPGEPVPAGARTVVELAAGN